MGDIRLRFAIAVVAVFCWVVPLGDATGARVVARDGGLVRYENGVVYDAASGLEWLAGPDRETDWAEAKRWAAGLRMYSSRWRMPDCKELDPLRSPGMAGITPLLSNSGYWVWCGQTAESASRWVFRFSYGGEGWTGGAPPEGGRAIAVRKHL